MSEEKKFSIWSKYTDADKRQLEELGAGYIDFISRCKTERESVNETIRLAEASGYDRFEPGMKLKSGDKVYAVCMNFLGVCFSWMRLMQLCR